MVRPKFSSWKNREAFNPAAWESERHVPSELIEEVLGYFPNIPLERIDRTKKLLRWIVRDLEIDMRLSEGPSLADNLASLKTLRDGLQTAHETAAVINDNSMRLIWDMAARDEEHHVDTGFSGAPGRLRVEEDLRAIERLVRWIDAAAADLNNVERSGRGPSLGPEIEAVEKLKLVWFYMSKDEVSRSGLERIARALIVPVCPECRTKEPDLERAIRHVFAKGYSPSSPAVLEFKALANPHP